MPKLKSHRGARKRIKITATGKIMVKGAGVRHILTKKSRKRVRSGQKMRCLNATDAKLMKMLVPNIKSL